MGNVKPLLRWIPACAGMTMCAVLPSCRNDGACPGLDPVSLTSDTGSAATNGLTDNWVHLTLTPDRGPGQADFRKRDRHLIASQLVGGSQ